MGTKVYAAIPVLNEFENLPELVDDLINQQDIAWNAVFCINQPEEWWKITQKTDICHNNQSAIEWLKAINHPGITIIDKSSQGKGWIGKNHGVGWARKTAMDAVSAVADADDLLVSMDADTRYPAHFFRSINEAFLRHPRAIGLSAPYLHPLGGDEIANRCILRYEIYMRNYALNMLLIGNPYAFSAIGSGMACKVSDYRRIGGLTPKMSGEDFYFMQKLRKAGNIIVDSGVYIEPDSRFSDRVYFGTGPAMIRGREGNWDSYPIYHHRAFQDIKQTYDLFDRLFDSDIATPMDPILLNTTNGRPVWQSLRENASTKTNFVKACMQKADALRILQFLKEGNHSFPDSNEARLKEFLTSSFEADIVLKGILYRLDFKMAPVSDLEYIRNFMVEKEANLQKKKGIV